MDIRYSVNQRDFKRYTTDEIRDEFLITDLFKADEVTAVYSHVDRMVTLGCMPVNETVSIDKGIDCWKNFGTHYFLERREIGIFNIGEPGVITADGVEYKMGHEDCLYITMGTKEVTFASNDAAHPAKFYMVSAPAHKPCKTTFISIQDANKRPMGACLLYTSACDDEVNIVMGLDLGADDYITKPFRVRELISRMNSVLRRAGKKQAETTINYQDLSINTIAARVFKNNQEVFLTGMEYRLLLILATV